VSILIERLAVPATHGVVCVEAAGATDLPIPETGAEPAVATGESVLVATRGDRDGPVTIEVHRGQPARPGTKVFEGELSFTTPELVIGNPLLGRHSTVPVERIGWLPVWIYVDPPDLPSRVVVVLS
jgi:hypothetical protein